MFERIAIRRRSAESLGQPIDLGVLAESLIYYGEVRLIANSGVLKALLRTASPDAVLSLVENDFLKLAYEYDDVAVLTSNTGTPSEAHEPIYWNAPHLELQEFLPATMEEIVGKPGRARRLAQRLIRKAEVIRHTESITDEARADLSDAAYVQDAVAALLNLYVPEYSAGKLFRAHRSGKQFVVETNIDFQAANIAYHTRVSPKHSSLSAAYLLAHLVSVKADLHFAARFSSEIAVDDVDALVMRTHVERLLTDVQPSSPAIARFQEYVLGDARAIGEAVRSGARSIADLLPLLERAAKFKEWLSKESVQTDAVKAYLDEVASGSWIEKLPVKGARWFIFKSAGLALDALGAGGLGTLAGTALSAADTFLLDRILKGWKPTQFVEALRDFSDAAAKGRASRK